jgi:hypothetical protein
MAYINIDESCRVDVDVIGQRVESLSPSSSALSTPKPLFTRLADP